LSVGRVVVSFARNGRCQVQSFPPRVIPAKAGIHGVNSTGNLLRNPLEMRRRRTGFLPSREWQVFRSGSDSKWHQHRKSWHGPTDRQTFAVQFPAPAVPFRIVLAFPATRKFGSNRCPPLL